MTTTETGCPRETPHFGTLTGIQPSAPAAVAGVVSPAAPGSSASSGPLLMSMEQLRRELGGVSERQVAVLRGRGWLPAPVELGPRLLRWRRADVAAAIAAMPSKSDNAEPPQLLRSRIERAKQTGNLSAEAA